MKIFSYLREAHFGMSLIRATLWQFSFLSFHILVTGQFHTHLDLLPLLERILKKIMIWLNLHKKLFIRIKIYRNSWWNELKTTINEVRLWEMRGEEYNVYKNHGFKSVKSRVKIIWWAWIFLAHPYTRSCSYPPFGFYYASKWPPCVGPKWTMLFSCRKTFSLASK